MKPTQPADFDALFSSFKPITLEQLSSVTLQHRTDTKFLLTLTEAFRLFELCRDHYAVLETDGIRGIHYRTLYFDTDSRKLYRMHHRGQKRRWKLRSREYIESGLFFQEIKLKEAGKTRKLRQRTEKFSDAVSGSFAEFVRSHLPEDQYHPALTIECRRFTFSDLQFRSRITLDTELKFYTDEKQAVLQNCAVLELKQERTDRKSVLFTLLRQMKLRPSSISKYCTASALLNPDLKQNSFKPILKTVSRIENGGSHAR